MVHIGHCQTSWHPDSPAPRGDTDMKCLGRSMDMSWLSSMLSSESSSLCIISSSISRCIILLLLLFLAMLMASLIELAARIPWKLLLNTSSLGSSLISLLSNNPEVIDSSNGSWHLVQRRSSVFVEDNLRLSPGVWVVASTPGGLSSSDPWTDLGGVLQTPLLLLMSGRLLWSCLYWDTEIRNSMSKMAPCSFWRCVSNLGPG